MPDARQPLGLPAGLLADHELEVGVLGAGFAANPTVLHLGEVALEEADLVLAGRAGRARRRPPHRAEVVEHLPLVDCRLRLRDQLDPPHVLPVPVCC